MNKFNIDNKVAIITGGSGLLGTTFCNAIAEIGGIPVILDKNIKEAKLLGIIDLHKKYELNEIIQGDSIFFFFLITDSEILKGITKIDGNYRSETLVTHKGSDYIKIIKNINIFNE